MEAVLVAAGQVWSRGTLVYNDSVRRAMLKLTGLSLAFSTRMKAWSRSVSEGLIGDVR